MMDDKKPVSSPHKELKKQWEYISVVYPSAVKTTTLRKEIKKEMKANRDSWKNLVATTLSDDDLDYPFPDPAANYMVQSLPEVPHYTWTETRCYFFVYFQHGGNCMPYIDSVPRHPGKFKPRIL